MKRNQQLLQAIGNISDELISDAAPQKTTIRRYSTMKKIFALAAAIFLAFTLSISALAAADYEPAYKLLYSLSPAIAQRLKPVKLFSEDKGIRLEVLSAHVAKNVAEIYLSVQDLEGDRIDQTTDLFDSYGINAPFESMGSCENVGFDPQSKTATFLVTITGQDEQEIAGDKITFSLRQLLGKKHTFDAALPALDLTHISTNPDTMKPAQVFGGGGEGFDSSRLFSDDFRVLTPSGMLYSPLKGVDITGMGYVSGQLRIQIQYENVLETDNHGYIYFKNSSGDTIHSAASYSFSTDAQGKERYEEHLFDLTQEDLASLKLHGWFVTSDSLITGSWSVTFPLESVR